MTTIQIPLDKNPDVDALTADSQPGDKVYGCFTIKSRDPQTLELRIEEMAQTPEELPKPDEYSEDDNEENEDGEDAEPASAPDKSPEGNEAEPKPVKKPGSMGRELAAKMMGGDSSF